MADTDGTGQTVALSCRFTYDTCCLFHGSSHASNAFFTLPTADETLDTISLVPLPLTNCYLIADKVLREERFAMFAIPMRLYGGFKPIRNTVYHHAKMMRLILQVCIKN